MCHNRRKKGMSVAELLKSAGKPNPLAGRILNLKVKKQCAF